MRRDLKLPRIARKSALSDEGLKDAPLLSCKQRQPKGRFSQCRLPFFFFFASRLVLAYTKILVMLAGSTTFRCNRGCPRKARNRPWPQSLC